MSISLQSALTTCKVNTGATPQLAGARIEDPDLLLCPWWNGLDQYGRSVCYDSYNTKTAGCASALDRVAVENYLRPNYIEYTALDAEGYLNPAALGQPAAANTGYKQMSTLDMIKSAQNVNNITAPGTGLQYSNNNTLRTINMAAVNGNAGISGCGQSGACASANQMRGVREGYTDTRSTANFNDRRNLSTIQGWKGHCRSCAAGNQ